MLGDYEDAICNSCNTTFAGKTEYLGDYFHFIYANSRWLAKHSTVEEKRAIIQDLRELWRAGTLVEFNRALERLHRGWAVQHEAFARYFKATWQQNTIQANGLTTHAKKDILQVMEL
jgi:hypothetical protein